jgi:Flp pilus assembly protein TadD
MAPGDPDAQVALANALLQKGRIDDAIVHYQNALTVRPDYFLARYGLGHAFVEKGEPDAAIEHCRAALLIRPDNADCHTILGVALESKGRTAEAIDHYEKALQFAPQSVSALNNLAWLLATSSEPSLRNGPRALQLARQADQLSGSINPLVLRTLAAAYAETGQFQKAIETARAAARVARMHGEESLIAELQQEMALYELRLPYREKAR